ncbi:TIGR01777 family oxidoreductase [Variovorax sp. JS1663]|uniref:TIGR01777 family oxidoreductase n=1 Tax=Variovorax sp. JS1663 TaxID=1851577 RepID=UPI000B346673|nr:TIGR01777 family oxidoreductase [Variovorax sp. JS1663]OUM03563.1 TIGR01777 family protein [Variovorax sp. JS1663]
MNSVYSLLLAQALLGAFDNLWHHELGARLPQRASARHELALHAAREAIYALLFVGLAWLEWRGLWVLMPTGLLLIELVITGVDFLEEDRTRTLPPLERVLHTVLAVGFGALLGLLAPVFLQWLRSPSALIVVHQGTWSWCFTFGGLAVMLWSVRNLRAAMHWHAAAGRQDVTPARVRRTSVGANAPAVLVTGGTGFLGAALVRGLLDDAQRVIVLTRDVRQARRQFDDRVWAVDRLDDIPPETRIQAVVHLAGAPVLGLPWTAPRRRLLIESRTRTMQSLLQLMRRLDDPPRVLVSASAVGYYGLPGAQLQLNEAAPPDPDRFQSALCVAAEHEARRAEALDVRVVCLRLGIVLGHGGGAFPGLDAAARLGLGARIGSGRQPVPWVHVDDAIALMRFAMAHEGLHGPVNGVAPGMVAQAQFAREIAAVHGRRARLRVPAWLLERLLGEMAELLTQGQRVAPIVALRAGFRFAYPSLPVALRQLAAADA